MSIPGQLHRELSVLNSLLHRARAGELWVKDKKAVVEIFANLLELVKREGIEEAARRIAELNPKDDE